MTQISKKTGLWLGGFGALGSLLLFAGDMLFYYNGDKTDFLLNMSQVSSERIIWSGIFALLAMWLYLAGAGQIFFAFQPESAGMRWGSFLSFAMVVSAYGVVHGAYTGIAVAAKNAAALGLPPQEFAALAIAVNQALRKTVYFPFGVFTILFTISVWRKRTHYPRWILFFSPIVPFLLQGIILDHLTGKALAIIGGGYLNLILLLFFLTSTLALAYSKESQ